MVTTMTNASTVIEPAAKSPRRVAAGRINGLKRRPWTPEDRAQQRQIALANRPWEHSTGPRTPAGKLRSGYNGRKHQPRPDSLRQVRAGVMDVNSMISGLADLRRALGVG